MPPTFRFLCSTCGIQVDRGVDLPEQCQQGAPGIRRGQDLWLDYCCNCFVPSGWDVSRWPSYEAKACSRCKGRKSRKHQEQEDAATQLDPCMLRGGDATARATHTESERTSSGEDEVKFEGDGAWQCELRHLPRALDES